MSTFDRDCPLELRPHYSDDRFDEERAVFGQEEKGLFYNYSDRLWQADWEKSKEAAEAANASGATRDSATWLETWLSHWHGKKVDLKHVVSGVNKSNGHPYNVYGYIISEEES